MSSQTVITQIPQQEIADWFDNPITEVFFDAIENALKAVDEDKKGAKRATPIETQLRHEFLDGCEWAFTDLLEYRDHKILPGVGDGK